MAINIGTLLGYLKLDDGLTPALVKANIAIGRTSSSLKKMSDSVHEAGMALLPLSAAVGAAGFAVAKLGSEFEKTFTQVETLAGVAHEEVKGLQDSVMQMSEDLGKGPRELGEAFYFIVSAGLKGQSALDALTASAKASAIGLGETKTVADAVTSAVNAYGEKNLSSAEAARVMIATVREGKAEADSIAGALGRVVPIANEMGVRFQDLGSFIAATTKIGLDAEESATALRGALITLANPTKEQTDTFAALAEKGLLPLGFNLESVRKKIKEEGLAQAFMELTKATDGNVEALTAIIGNVRAATGVLGAYGRQGQATLEVQTRMRENLNELDDGFKKVQETVDFKWNAALAGAERIAIEAFTVFKGQFVSFLDNAKPVIKVMEDIVKGMASWSPAAQTATFGIGAFLAVLGPGLIALGSAFKVVAFSMDGFLLANAQLIKFAPGVAAAFTSIGGAVGGLAVILGQAALVVGTFFAAWKFSEWVQSYKPFGEATMSLGESFSFGLVKLQNWATGTQMLDSDIENSILAQRNLGQAVTETAAAFDISAVSVEECVAQAKEFASVNEQAIDLTARFTAEMAELQQQVTNLTEPQREAIRVGLDMQKNTADIATGLGVTEAAVKAYAAALKDADKEVEAFLEAQRKSREETQKLAEEYTANQVKLEGTSLDARIAQIEEWANKEKAAITGTGEAYKAHYAAIDALSQQRKNMELSNIEQMNDLSLEALQQRADRERQTYQDMTTSGLTFSREVLEDQKNKVIEADQAVRDYGKTWTDSMTQATGATKQQTEMVRTLSGEMKTLEEFKKQQSTGGSIAINKGNLKFFLERWQIPVDFGMKGAEMGMSAQEISEAYKAFKNGQIKSIEEWVPAGPRIPGFAQGGMATMRVGENGPETIRAPFGSVVYPNGVVPRGGDTFNGGGMHLTFNVNGTAQESANQIYGILMGKLKSSRQFGAV